VLHVPSISKPLLSVSQLVADNAIIVEFNSCSCFIKDRATQQILLQGLLRNGLYTVSSQIQQHIAFNCDVVSLETWHHRLAHASTFVLQHIISSKQLACNSRSLGVCESCSQSKSHKQLFSSSLTTTTKPLELVHCDVWGPSPIVSNNGFRYYILFTDHFSRFNWISFVLIRVRLLCCLRISNLWFKIFSPQQSKLFKLTEAQNFYLLFEQTLKSAFKFHVLTHPSRTDW
jgi:GAG-pre-integrase domain